MQDAELQEETKRLRTRIELEKENLQHMERIHHQEILEKERTLQLRLDQKRTEIAVYWEERLLHECKRLKTELEQLHNEEKEYAIKLVKQEKDAELKQAKDNWQQKIQASLNEVGLNFFYYFAQLPIIYVAVSLF